MNTISKLIAIVFFIAIVSFNIQIRSNTSNFRSITLTELSKVFADEEPPGSGYEMIVFDCGGCYCYNWGGGSWCCPSVCYQW